MRKTLTILALLLLSPFASAQINDPANVFWTSDNIDWTRNIGCPTSDSPVAPVSGDLCFVTHGTNDQGGFRLSKHIYLCLMIEPVPICRWHTVEARSNDAFMEPPGVDGGIHIPIALLVFTFQRGTHGPDPWNSMPWCLGINCDDGIGGAGMQ